MKFSQAVEYGILGLLELAKSNREMSLGELAEAARVPESFLAKIFQKLKREGIVQSKRGKGGGFTLPQSSLHIDLWKIYEIIDHHISLQECVGIKGKNSPCAKFSHCGLQKVWNEAQQALETVLKKWTLKDLL